MTAFSAPALEIVKVLLAVVKCERLSLRTLSFVKFLVLLIFEESIPIHGLLISLVVNRRFNLVLNVKDRRHGLSLLVLLRLLVYLLQSLRL